MTQLEVLKIALLVALIALLIISTLLYLTSRRFQKMDGELLLDLNDPNQGYLQVVMNEELDKIRFERDVVLRVVITTDLHAPDEEPYA